MPYCRYCVEYNCSKQRNEPKSGEDVPKNRRVCAATKSWKSAKDEMCEEFVTYNQFWCDRLQCCMDIDSCLNRVKKKLHKYCKRSCTQYQDVLDAIRMRSRTRSKIN